MTDAGRILGMLGALFLVVGLINWVDGIKHADLREKLWRDARGNEILGVVCFLLAIIYELFEVFNGNG